MTPLQIRTLAHLVMMAKLEKNYAWWSAKHYAEICPHELGELPAMLTREMLSSSRGRQKDYPQTHEPTGEPRHQSQKPTNRLAGR